MKFKLFYIIKYLLVIFLIGVTIYLFFLNKSNIAKIYLVTSIPFSVNTSLLQRLWTPEEHRNMLDLFSTVMDAMETGGVPIFINYGTLLGSLRHHDIIPWDDDADVGAPMNEKTRITSVLKILTSKNYSSTWTANTQIRVFGPYSKLFQKDWPWRWPYIDVDLYSEDSTHIWFYNSGNVYKHPKAKIFPLHKRPLGSIQVNSPHDGYDCLGRMYSDLKNCTNGFNHRLGVETLPRYSIPCSKLSSFYPLVLIDVSAKGELLEILKVGYYNISRIVSPEPFYIANKTVF